MSEPILVDRLKGCPACGGILKIEDIRILGQLRRLWVCQDKTGCGHVQATYSREDES